MAEKTPPDPIELFQQWLDEARRSEPNDPSAMTLATVDASGAPAARMMLLKDADQAGFVFYTNIDSRKGRELDATRQASLAFHWKSLRRQVRVDGTVERVGDDEADEYFATRPRGSQIGAWASDQSRPLESQAELERRVARFAARYAAGEIPRPPFWTGYRVAPQAIEFWRDRPFRLHERLLYEHAPDGGWTRRRLYP